MKPRARLVVLGLALCFACALPASAQMGELQLGGVVSYGAPRSFARGAGVVAGIGLARLVYVGARWVYQAGGRERPDGVQAEIATHTQLVTADFGTMLPVAGVEVVPGIGFGALRFTQSDSPPTHAWALAVAPGVSLHAHVAGLVAIPEIEYVWADAPRLPRAVAHRGPVAALRLVIPIELRRIRY